MEAKRAKGGVRQGSQQKQLTAEAMRHSESYGADKAAALTPSLSAIPPAEEAGAKGHSLMLMQQALPLSAADLEGLMEGVAHDCRQLSSVNGLLLALEIYSAAVAVSSPRPRPTSAESGERRSTAAVRAVAAASGVSEDELLQLLSPSGQELMLGYEEAVRLALQEVLRGRAAAAAAGEHAIGARLEGYEVRLRDSQRRIREASQTIRSAMAGMWRAGASADISARRSVAGVAGTGLTPPAASAATPPKYSSSPSAGQQAVPAPTPPGSSPPAPRQWVWPGAPVMAPLTGGAPPFAPAGSASRGNGLHQQGDWGDELSMGDDLAQGARFPAPLLLKAAPALPSTQPSLAPSRPQKVVAQRKPAPPVAAAVSRPGLTTGARLSGFPGSMSESSTSSTTSRRRNSREQQPGPAGSFGLGASAMTSREQQQEDASTMHPSRLSLSVNGRPLRTSSDQVGGPGELFGSGHGEAPRGTTMRRAPGEHVLGPEFGLLQPRDADRHAASEADGPRQSFAIHQLRSASPLPQRHHQGSSMDSSGYAAAYQRQKRATGGAAGA